MEDVQADEYFRFLAVPKQFLEENFISLVIATPSRSAKMDERGSFEVG